MLSSLVYDYFLDYQKANEVHLSLQANRQDLGKSLIKMSIDNPWLVAEVDPNITVYESDIMGRTQLISAASERKNTRVETPDLLER